MSQAVRGILTVGLAPAFLFQHAYAQDNSADAGTVLQEVVVTAEKRPQKESEVPDSLTVFTAQQIEDDRIQGLQDFVALTPNFEIHEGQGPGVFQMSIRGISQANMGEAPVTMVVDGVTLPYASSFGSPLFDIQQIEVLKGPQGALYGQDSIGGAIVVTTKQPTNHFEGSLYQSVGRGGDVRTQAVFSGPLMGDWLLFRVGALYHDTPGLVDFAFLPRKADYQNDKAVRAELKAIFSENLTATLSYEWHRTTGGALPLTIESESFGSGIPGVSTAQVNQHIVVGAASGDTPNLNLFYGNSGSLKIDWTLPFATLTSVSAVEELEQTETQDLDVTDIPFVRENPGHIPVHGWLQDLHLISTDTGPLQWIVGLFAQQVHTGFDYIVQLNTNLFAPVPNLSPAAANWIPFQFNNLTQHLNAYAGSAQVSYKFTSALQLIVSGRYDYDPRTSETQSFMGYAPELRATFKEFEPKASLEYAFDAFGAEQHAYFTYAKGYRPGGFNSGANSEVEIAFPSEVTQNFELGAKFSLFDRRAMLDVAAFHNIYSNQQQTLVVISPGGGATSDVFSIDRTNINGFELSLQGHPGAGLDISLGFGYTDATIGNFGNSLNGTGLNPTDFNGKTVPLVAKYTANLAVQQTIPLTGAMNGFYRVDVARYGKLYWYPDNLYSQDPYTLVDVQIGTRFDKWSWDLYGKNIFGQRYNVLFFDNDFVRTPSGVNFSYRSLPSTYGIEARYRF